MKRLRNFVSILLVVLVLSTLNVANALDYSAQTYTTYGYNEYTVPVDGYYRLQVWGAQGGGGSYGGKGGYATGTILLMQGEKLSIYVGGQGYGKTGGYNGGGQASTYNSDGSGGGATDIRINGKELSNRIIVAGGGGGGTGSYYYNGGSIIVTGVAVRGGAGGGLSGLKGADAVLSAPGYSATAAGAGGGQSYTGGIGASGTGSLGTGASSSNGTGGGGGYYGGGAGGLKQHQYGSNQYNAIGGGGGGSSYIGGVTDGSTISGDSTMPSVSGSTQTGQSGHGAAAVTLISTLKPTLTVSVSTTEYTKNPVIITVTADKECTFKYSTDESNVENGTEFTGSFTVYNNGVYYIYAVDSGGSDVTTSVTVSNLTAKTVSMEGSVGQLADGTVPILVSNTPTVFKATLPISLPVNVDANGQVETASNAEVTNKSSYGCVEIKNISVDPLNDWSLNAFADDFSSMKINSKNFGLTLWNCDSTSDIIAFNSDVLNLNDSQNIEYNVKIAPQANGLSSESICNIVVTVGWYK